MADAEAGEFWALFGGFAPLPRKTASEETGEDMEAAVKLLWYNLIPPNTYITIVSEVNNSDNLILT
jgi:hypothetical protein